ncbi:bacteriocin immunity protein [Enterobacter sichuanensis]|uniref:bacteriocin immunity protein n=1 Tax=Enterobacter sichuanensis TaxID=2071710 RepID=UPI002DB65CFD|nr:bacteriocin immunity protein [Enterobacter sichuanensis]MEB5961974.1 bacteriocin immunity protein [Enterobacter sichuanensis]
MKSIGDYTENEFLDLVRKICTAASDTEEEGSLLVLEFERLSEYPKSSDVIFYPEKGKDYSPEGIVREVKEWRRENGKSGFKE